MTQFAQASGGGGGKAGTYTAATNDFNAAANDYFRKRGWPELKSESRTHRKIDAKLPHGNFLWVGEKGLRTGKTLAKSRAINPLWKVDEVKEYWSLGL